MPDRPAATLNDDQAAPAVVRLLDLSRGASLPLRLLADVVRAGAAFVATAFMWSWTEPMLLPRVSSLSTSVEPYARRASLLVLAFAVTVLVFRLTKRRFKTPLGRRSR